MKRAIMVNSADNVSTALDDLIAGDSVNIVSESQEVIQEVKIINAVPFGHKFALANIDKGANIIKYGEVIGIASQAIEKGDHVHVHNINSARFSVSNAKYKREV